MTRWISPQQQQRDHAGKRDICAACGHHGSTSDPLDLDEYGFRVHARHFTEPRSGLRPQLPRKKGRAA